jgi:hypothetical protein
MARKLPDPTARFALFVNRGTGGEPERLTAEDYPRAVAAKLAEAERRKTGAKVYARRVTAAKS